MTKRKTVETADPDDEVIDDVEAKRLWEEFYASVAPGPADVRRADVIFERLTRPPKRREERSKRGTEKGDGPRYIDSCRPREKVLCGAAALGLKRGRSSIHR